MSYRDHRRRIWLKRLCIVVVAAIVGIGIAGFSNTFVGNQDLKTSPSSTVSESLSPLSVTDDWKTILQNLDNLRSTAILQKDVSQLQNIYFQNSPLRVSDESIIKSLIDLDLTVENLYFEILNIFVISHRWSNQEEVVEMEVTDKRSEYFLVKGTKKTRVPKRDPETWLVSLEKVGDRWLISNATSKTK